MRSRRLFTVAGIVLLGLGAALYLRSPQKAATGGPQLVPDAGGPVTLAVCSVNSARRALLHNARLAANIVNALPERARILLLVNDRDAFRIASNPWPQRVSFVELPADTPITIWPQDPFLVLRDREGRGRLLVSREFDRAGDRAMAARIAATLGWSCDDSSLTFEGGNIVADSDHAFVGANTIRYNAIKFALSDPEVVERFERELGRPVLVVGPLPQPIAHIDMMLTPLGDRRLALADPAWGARVAEKEVAQAPDRVEAFERRCEQMYLPGKAATRGLRDAEGHAIRPPRVVGRTRQAIEQSRAMAPSLDRLAEELAACGYDVVRIPYLSHRERSPATAPGTPATHNDRGRTDTAPADDRADTDEDFKPEYPQLTYNNVLLELTDNRRIVYLPQYDWPALDDLARETWAKLGFEVRPIKGFATSAMCGGSLRCCVKVLSREEAR
ncbi:MAG TPA: hypothetical protein PLC79_00190 [Phycisphaerae bacterium]|nr:hypothetical protein [Phycisphaerae bacterium]